MEILCFFAGIAFVYTKSIYPLLIVIASLILRPSCAIIVWFLMAIIWGLVHLCWVKEVGMPNVRILDQVTLHGVVASLPISNFHKTQFEFAVDSLDKQKVKATVLLSCYQHCPVFSVGQIWALEAKLRKPENLANPGHFDFVGGLSARHIHWVGYIKHATQLGMKVDWQQSLLVLRDRLALTFGQSITDVPVLGVVQALTLGVTTNLDKSQWDLFRRTGTTHLMVISGSHIGLIVGFSFWLMKWLWSRASRLCLYCPAVKIASGVAMLMGFGYALLAGFAPPLQRALLACFFILLRNFLNQRFTVWQAWRYGLLAILIYEPHAVLLPGFYLSFLAVAILILINQRVMGGVMKKAICIQLACLFGLMPLSLFWFSYGAINGLLANALAIPLVSFVIVPFSLISLFLMQCFAIDSLMLPIKWSVQCLLYFLQWVDSLAILNLDFSFPTLLAPLALMLAMLTIVFLPSNRIPRQRFAPRDWVSCKNWGVMRAIFPALVVLVLASLFPAYLRIKPGDVKVDILDVGQGLAVVVNTANHVLIYDTGVKFYQGEDMGKLAIIPYLNTLGIRKIDKVVISHPDLDHRGGLSSLEEKYNIPELIVNEVSFYHRGKSCHHYPAWQWDGVSMRFLAIRQRFGAKNNTSCVLQIDNGIGKVLLTGDIEKSAEKYLVKTYGNQLSSDVLLIPHHGSKTSSSPRFIKQVAPHYAIISVGFANRYHFPHQQTLATLEQEKISTYTTAECGMVSVVLSKKDKAVLPSCFNPLFQEG